MGFESGPVYIFQENIVPRGARLAGWAAMVQELGIQAPVKRPSCVSDQHINRGKRDHPSWQVFDTRYWPGDTLIEHLVFAIRHEDLDLLLLKRIFERIPEGPITELVRATSRSVYARRLWFLYEHLMGRELNADDAGRMGAVDLLDPARYVTGKPRLSPRHRVRDNLLGTGAFCPMIRRTPALEELMALDLSAQAHETVGRTGAHLVARAASFMLLADSRASFQIEGERPPRDRLQRWGRAILQAGKHPLTLEEILRLQRILIEDNRFTPAGLRTAGVFLGERDHNEDPLPEFIGARPSDLTELLNGLLAANDRMREDGVDAVLKAASTAFGFVYIHPFEDGNGRLHRCLIHHVLAERKFTPPGLVFPVSSVMLDRIDDYRATLQSHSAPLMPFIEWRTTPERNVEVLNDTADLYRYYDCTAEAEFLYACVRRTVEEDLPREIEYLKAHDQAMRRIMDVVEMPDRTADDLIRYIRENRGKLSKQRRKGEYQKLDDREVELIERIVQDAFQIEPE